MVLITGAYITVVSCEMFTHTHTLHKFVNIVERKPPQLRERFRPTSSLYFISITPISFALNIVLSFDFRTLNRND